MVANWWNSLDQADRRDVVNAVLIDNTLEDDDERGPCDSAVWCGSYDHDNDPLTDPIRVIGVYGTGLTDDDSVALPALPAAAMQVVTQAFHWDMLTGAEMIAAAKAGGLENPSRYAKPFRSLTLDTPDDPDTSGVDEGEDGQRTRVQSLYQEREAIESGVTAVSQRDPVLVRGQGGGDLNEDAPSQVAVLTVTAADSADDIGTATITVKASDSEGQLIPPDTGRETVGSSVDIEVNGKELETLRISMATSGYVAQQDLQSAIVPAHLMFTIEADSDTVATIQVLADEDTPPD